MSVLFVCLYSMLSMLQVSNVGGVTVCYWVWGSEGELSMWRYDILLFNEKKLSVLANTRFRYDMPKVVQIAFWSFWDERWWR